MKNKKILLIDDDYSIRQSLKIFLNNLDSSFEIYSSADGVEGLGLMYVITPDIIIVDTTLPKYSGKEILDFISTNAKFNDKKVLVMHDGTIRMPEVNIRSVLLDKKNRKTFLSKLENSIGKKYKSTTLISKVRFGLLKCTFRWANKSDLLIHTIHSEGIGLFSKLMVLWPLWMISQLITSISLTLLFVFGGVNATEMNTPQLGTDAAAFRVRVYPTLIGITVSILFLLVQVLLFVAGGIVIFNTVRLDSIFK